jgi:hypothetical protein
MGWDVEYTDQFGRWWDGITEAEQDDIAAVVELLEQRGPTLEFPYTSGIRTSRHANMRELRIQSQGNPSRIFYAFDPRRSAILLIGGNKVGDDRFYQIYVPIADRLYDEYLDELRQEGLIP